MKHGNRDKQQGSERACEERGGAGSCDFLEEDVVLHGQTWSLQVNQAANKPPVEA